MAYPGGGVRRGGAVVGGYKPAVPRRGGGHGGVGGPDGMGMGGHGGAGGGRGGGGGGGGCWGVGGVGGVGGAMVGWAIMVVRKAVITQAEVED